MFNTFKFVIVYDEKTDDFSQIIVLDKKQKRICGLLIAMRWV